MTGCPETVSKKIIVSLYNTYPKVEESMTAIAFSLNNTEAMIMIDTLITSPNEEFKPFEQHKYYMSDKGDILITPMGSLSMTLNLFDFIDDYLAKNDIYSFIQNSQEELTRLWSKSQSNISIFMFFIFFYSGNDVNCFGFSSREHFNPIKFKKSGLHVIHRFPSPPKRLINYFNIETAFIETIKAMKNEDDLEEPSNRAGIGGHIDFIRGANGCFTACNDHYSF